MTPTPLDLAHAAMESAPDDDAARLGFYARLAEGEVFVLLESDDEPLTPRVFALEDGPVVLGFDREDRLADFAGGPAPYAAMAGRAAVLALAGQGLALGLNLGVAPSSFILPAAALDWLAATLSHAPQETEARVVGFDPPGALPPAVLSALDGALGRAAGLAEAAVLTGVRYADGRRGHLLAIIAAMPGAQGALARAVADALTFSGVEAGEMDVIFVLADDPRLPLLARSALRFDMPPAPPGRAAAPAAPGSDPARPPILR